MTLYQVIRVIEKTAAEQPPIACIVRNDVFRINASPAVQYGAFAWLQGEHRASEDGNMMQWAFTFFYVDRLTEDKGNEIQIQSTGIEVLTNILHRLADLGIFAGDYTFQTFNQRFTDECAGVFCRLTMETAIDVPCPEEWSYTEESGALNMLFDEAAQCWKWNNGEKTVNII